MADKTIISLWQRFFREGLSPEEKEALAQWIENSSQNEELKALLENSWNEFEPDGKITDEKAASMLGTILARAKGIESAAVPVIPLKTKIWKRMAVAASIIFVVGLGAYLLFLNKSDRSNETGFTKTEVPAEIKAPETNRAVITLANGQQVYLDSVGNGALAMQGNVQIIKESDGRITYTGSEKEVVFNTLSNPRGSRVIDMTLADGSRVWLNAGSSITYPVAFVGPERKVSITGEGYFEIEHDVNKPFFVSKGDIQVQVLGTHFNVNAYDDEPNLKVTLLEGSVRVTLRHAQSNKTQILKPGQQAVTGVSGELSMADNIDLDQVMAWRNNKFVFGDKADIRTIMRQIARWYDVNVEYRGTITNHFGGSISRDVSMSEVFRVLQATGNVKCKIEGKKVVVMPQ